MILFNLFVYIIYITENMTEMLRGENLKFNKNFLNPILFFTQKFLFFPLKI